MNQWWQSPLTHDMHQLASQQDEAWIRWLIYCRQLFKYILLKKIDFDLWFKSYWSMLLNVILTHNMSSQAKASASMCLYRTMQNLGIISTKSTLWLLNHWGPRTHICVGKLTTIGSDNGLSPGWGPAIIWTTAGILLIWPLGTDFSEILIKILTVLFKKMRFKWSSAKWWPFCRSLNMLKGCNILHSNKKQK